MKIKYLNKLLITSCNIKNEIFKAELQHFADKNLPKDNKPYHNKDANKVHIIGLKPNKTIFYF